MEEINLESLLSPLCYGEEEPHPPTGIGKSLGFSLSLRGGIVEGAYSYIFNENSLRCLPLSPSSPSTYNPAVPTHSTLTISPEPYLLPTNYNITCATHFTHKSTPLLLLGLQLHSRQGALLIFSPLRSKPLNMTLLPRPVSALELITQNDSESLMAMVGVVAVGMIGGGVALLDLALDCLLEKSEWDVFYGTSKRLEWVGLKEKIVWKRKKWEEEGIGVGIWLDDGGEEDVTCLKYWDGMLGVGGGGGGVVIWCLREGDIIHTIPRQRSIPHPPHTLSFTSPSDDESIYLWILYGLPTFELHATHISLHSLQSNQASCLSLKLSDQFSTAPTPATPSRPVAMRSLSSTLTYFVWECGRVYYVGLFDIDQWYSWRMPNHLVFGEDGLCEYWVGVPVENCGGIVDCWVGGLECWGGQGPVGYLSFGMHGFVYPTFS